MLFSEFGFFFFLAVVFFVYWGIKNNTTRKTWLLLCSYIFYSAWDWRFLSLIIISTLIDYTAGRKIYQALDKKGKKRWLLVSILGNLGILGFFKYYNFFIDSFSALLTATGVPILSNNIDIILPVGISFYTFQTLSYSIDIYFDKLKPSKSMLDVALFVAFFPQLVAGPIVRAKAFLPQLTNLKLFDSIRVKYFIGLFILGLFKKIVVADNLATVVDTFFANPEHYSLLASFVGVISFTIQLYCDFSGYSDMAIACAGLLGYELCENFRFPYFSENSRVLWTRWHISLSSWFRDYVFFPLRGKRRGRIIKYRNYLIVMSLVGLWHGAEWHFVMWGAFFGIGMVVHGEWSYFTRKNKRIKKIMKSLGPLITYYWILVGLTIFRGNDLPTIMTIFESLVFFRSHGTQSFGYHVLIACILLAIAHFMFYKKIGKDLFIKIPTWTSSFLLGFAFYLTLMFAGYKYEPFIYFQF